MTHDEFLALVERTPAIGRRPNPEQTACILSDPTVPTMIVAGPGSGKTTVLVFRVMRHILTDRVAPERVLITTFTVKAAREVRSRLIEWGEALFEAALAGALDDADRSFLEHADINRVVTGTLDSICQEALGSDRRSDEPPLVTLEGFAAGVTLQRRGGFANAYRANRSTLSAFLSPFTMDGDPPETLSEAAAAMVPIVERFVQDRVDLEAFGAPDQPDAHRIVAGVAREYRAHLRQNNLLDFSSLEEALLDRVVSGRIPALLSDVAVVLVDEYQDTNALQEAIYLELVAATGASLTVVGDDDQSLYRFRGATIELFRAFIERCRARLGHAPDRPLYLVENYRSSQEIVDHFNEFVRGDSNFLPARIQPPKPVIHSNAGPSGLPVLAMFRPDPAILADDLADLLRSVFQGEGFRDADGHLSEPLRGHPDGGDLGDAVVLGFSVREMQRPYFGNEPKPRFAQHLRTALDARGMSMFNPRGRSLRDIEQVRTLLGLVLLAIDPADREGGPMFETMSVTLVAKYFMRQWIVAAEAFLASRPPDVYGRRIGDELQGWRAFVLTGRGAKATGRDWPFLDVIYGLLPWIDFFQDDPEGQVYLEAISRAAGQASGFSAYGARILRPTGASNAAENGMRSVQAVIRDVLAPIAEDVIEVDEEIMPSVPRDRLNVMTIHQAKGLEYPLVIVDVGADFKTDSPKNRFRRFPQEASATARLEDLLAPFTPDLGRLRTQGRTGLDRSFEDLIRLYYVAFSRPQTTLLLVGCDKALRWKGSIKNVALGFRQDGSWSWRDSSPPSTGRRPPAVVTPARIRFV